MSSVAKVARVLESFIAGRTELSVTDTVGLLDIPKSSASRMLKAMADAGLLEHAPGSRRYRIGPLAIGLGRAGRTQSRLMDRLHAMLAEVVRSCGHTGYVSVRDGLEIFGLRMIEGSHDLRVVREPGVRMPAVATAVGRALLAHCEAAARAEGFGACELMGTMAGIPLYLSAGYEVLEEIEDDRGGAPVPLKRMRKALS